MATPSSTVKPVPAALAPTAPPGAENPLKKKALRGLSELPPFSPIVNRLLASLAGEDVSFAELGELIEKDTVIAGNLLNVVNSALYARHSTINSVRHAVSVLGVAKLRNVVLGVSVAQLWSLPKVPASWSMKRFDMHSAAVAILCDLLAQRLPVAYPEGAFVAGLFHDLGRLLIAMTLPKESTRVWQQLEAEAPDGSQRTLIQCEESVFGFSHAELSAEALAVWKLPAPVQAAVATHHNSWIRRNEQPEGSSELLLGQLVDAANQYVNSIGDSISTDPRAGAANPSVIESLRLEPDRLATVLSEFREEYQSMIQFFK